MTVFLPLSSLTVHTYPFGLFMIKYSCSSRSVTGTPSTVTLIFFFIDVRTELGAFSVDRYFPVRYKFVAGAAAGDAAGCEIFVDAHDFPRPFFAISYRISEKLFFTSSILTIFLRKKQLIFKKNTQLACGVSATGTGKHACRRRLFLFGWHALPPPASG